MLRQKPANEEALQKLISFLFEIKSFAHNTPEQRIDVKYSIKTYQVAKRTFSDLKALKIITEQGDKIEFISKEDLRKIALKVLDYRLKKTKKQIHVPIPEFAGIADSLKTISERLEQLAVQNEKWLKTHKNSLVSNVENSDMFRVDDQRLYIAGQIAGNIFKESFQYNNECDVQVIDRASNFIVQATDDLINKLLNGRSDFVGNCFECKKAIYGTETYSKDLESGLFACKEHTQNPLVTYSKDHA